MTSVPHTVSPDLSQALRQHFGFRDFLDGQSEAVRTVLEGRDAVVVMPTGSGKSLCYQLAAMLMEGTALVVSPLISLMKDQVDALAARGLPATFINSSLAGDDMAERLRGLERGAYRLVYVAPERFRHARFCEALSRTPVTLLAVDEAHCISQWGHDFRPDYLRLRHLVERWPEARILALTATATPDVRADIVAQLGLGTGGRTEPAIFVTGFARPNLHLSVTRCGSHRQKLQRLCHVIRRAPTGIVYCATRKQVEKVAAHLKREGHACVIYHGGLPDEERTEIQDRFMNGRVPVVAATNAFGMGVDRSDLRFVVHWDVPGSLEAYYQEVGRAGRDGEEAICELLYNYADVKTQEFFLEGSNPPRETYISVWRAVASRCAEGPVTQPISAWATAAGGVKNEMGVRSVLAVFERSGLIHRAYESGARTYTTSLAPGADFGVMEAQFERLDEKRRRDERKLHAMLRYVDTPTCRHAHILGYFGEADADPDCLACDNCLAGQSGERRAPTEEEWERVQKTLSCVARMKGRFGRGRVAQVLVGSRAKPILDARLDELPTYGLLASCGEAYVRQLLDALLRDRSIEAAPGDYPTISLTKRGRDVMWKRVPLLLVWPVTRPTESAVSEPADAPAREMESGDAPLFEALRSWRIRMAKARRVPAYVICTDRTLAAIAAAKPTNLAELEALHGMGPAKITQYGDSILEVVDTFGRAGDE